MIGSQTGAGPSSEWVRLGDGVEVRPLVEGGGTALMLYRMEGGREYPLHAHPHAEYGTVILGRGELTLEDGSKTLNEGDSYYIPAHIAHGALLPPQPNPLVVLHVVVSDGRELDRDVFERLVRDARATYRADLASALGAPSPPARRVSPARRIGSKSPA